MTTWTDRDDDSSLPALWAAAAHIRDWLLSLFGAPVAIVAMGPLAPKEHAEIAGWLRPIEAIVRRLLFAEAAPEADREAASLARPAARTGEPRARTRRQVVQDPQDSAAWHVAFRACAAEAGGARSPDHPAPPAPSSSAQDELAGLHDPWPLAERIEAVMRVLADPAPYARRLARRLAARPALIARFVRPPKRKRRPQLGDWALEHAVAHAQAAAAAFDTG